MCTGWYICEHKADSPLLKPAAHCRPTKNALPYVAVTTHVQALYITQHSSFTCRGNRKGRRTLNYVWRTDDRAIIAKDPLVHTHCVLQFIFILLSWLNVLKSELNSFLCRLYAIQFNPNTRNSFSSWQEEKENYISSSAGIFHNARHLIETIILSRSKVHYLSSWQQLAVSQNTKPADRTPKKLSFKTPWHWFLLFQTEWA